MRTQTIAALAVFSLLILTALTPASAQPTTIRAGTLLDGKGATLRNQVITLDGPRIARIAPSTAPVTYDLSRLTVLPGLIDTHVHIDCAFRQRRPRLATRARRRPQRALRGRERLRHADGRLHHRAEHRLAVRSSPCAPRSRAATARARACSRRSARSTNDTGTPEQIRAVRARKPRPTAPT